MPITNTRRTHVLFICSRNQWRSPTAERVWRSDARLSVRSAGTASSAHRVVSEADIAWADVICVMEEKPQRHLRAQFGALLAGKPLHVLDIPDDYRFMDAELVELVRVSVAGVLDSNA
ncbi:MAG: low molecular weight protein tyrosine phosphatase family protein [Burkholderiaceae bacterium]